MDPAKSVPTRTDANIIVAGYNIQWLGSLPHDVRKLAKVISLFDVCGLIEVKAEKEIPLLVQALQAETSKDWGYVFGTRTHRPGSTYHEAFGFVFRRDRVELGDGLISNIFDKDETYRNDPFVASFRRAEFSFSMALLHTRWSDDSAGTRQDEVRGIAKQVVWMKRFVPEDDLIVTGDFNYPGTEQVMKDMARDANLKQLDNDPLSTFKADGSGFKSAYDHLYVGKEGKSTAARLIGECTSLDTCHVVYGDNAPSNMQLARTELSDHLPVFAEFKLISAIVPGRCRTCQSSASEPRPVPLRSGNVHQAPLR